MKPIPKANEILLKYVLQEKNVELYTVCNRSSGLNPGPI